MRKRTGRLLVAVAAAATALLTGCAGPAGAPTAQPASTGPAASSAPADPSSATASPSRALPSATGSALPTTKPVAVPDTLKFTATTVDGRPFDGASLAGKPVLFWFWAPWCPTCKSQIPQVQKIAKTYEGKVNVVGVGSLDGGAAIRQFADDAWGMTQLSDEQGKVWKHFEVAEQSSFVLLDAKGAKAYSVGYGGSDDLTAEVAKVAG